MAQKYIINDFYLENEFINFSVIQNLDKKYFKEEHQNDINILKKWHQKYKDSLYILKSYRSKKIHGYFSHIPIRNTIESSAFGQTWSDIDMDELFIGPVKKNTDFNLYFNSLVIDNPSNNPLLLRIFATLIRNKIVAQIESEMRINNIYLFSVTELGIRLAKLMGFEEIYQMETNEVHSFIIRNLYQNYRQYERSRVFINER